MRDMIGLDSPIFLPKETVSRLPQYCKLSETFSFLLENAKDCRFFQLMFGTSACPNMQLF